MKLIKYIKALYHEYIYRRHVLSKRYDLSEKGKCFCQYIIDKYINDNKLDNYIEAYETSLRKKIQKWRNENKVTIWFLPEDSVSINSPEETLKTFAALHYLTTLLSTCSKQE